VGELHQTGLDRDDPHVMGCAVLAGYRGNRILGRSSSMQYQIETVADLLRREAYELEPIHRVEACAHLAIADFEQGDIGAGVEWLQKSQGFLRELNPGMKVRTLPALSFLFDACIQYLALTNAGSGGQSEVELASTIIGKLTRFARIYPIGRPEKRRCQGDLCAMTGQLRKAIGLWRESLAQAVRLKMALVSFQAAERLSRAQHHRDVSERDTLVELPDEWSEELRTIAKRGARNSGVIDLLPLS
jgi:hypothetical protein